MSNDKNTSAKHKSTVFNDEYDQKVACPWCKSTDTTVASPFGGTVSEILFKCNGCKQTFGWMKWQHKMPD